MNPLQRKTLTMLENKNLNYHPMQACPFLDSCYQSEAKQALKAISINYRRQINMLQQSYEQNKISGEQLQIAKKNLLQEAAFILYPTPTDSPETSLTKLSLAAQRLSVK